MSEGIEWTNVITFPLFPNKDLLSERRRQELKTCKSSATVGKKKGLLPHLMQKGSPFPLNHGQNRQLQLNLLIPKSNYTLHNEYFPFVVRVPCRMHPSSFFLLLLLPLLISDEEVALTAFYAKRIPFPT